MHLLNIIVYLYVSSTTCAQQVFHIHTSQTDKVMNIICVYMPTIRCCGIFGHTMPFSGMVGNKKMQVRALWPVPSMDMSVWVQAETLS